MPVVPLAANLTTTPVLVAVGLAAAVALIAVWQVPKRQARTWFADGVRGKDLAELENGARTTLVQIVGGIALLATFAATWMQIADARRASERSLALTEQGQVTDRLTRAVEELGATTSSGSSRTEVRIGGIYSLGRVGVDSPRDRNAVDQILLAYLHANAAALNDDPLGGLVGSRTPACQQIWVIPRGDVQSTIKVLLMFPADQGYGDFRRLALSGVIASRGDFRQSQLTGSQLAGAKLGDARFDGSEMKFADLRAACLLRATFVGVTLGHSDLRNADLREADLRGAHLEFADLRGADASTTKNLTRAQLRRAVIDACTALPWRPRHGRCPDPLAAAPRR
jgi:hypothetical protein